MKFHFRIILTGVLAAISSNVLAQQPVASPPDLATLRSKTAGKRVESYLQAFNSGEEAKMREFFMNNVSAPSLQQVPIEARMGRYRQLHRNAGTFKLLKVLEVAEDHAGIVVETTQGMKLRMEFQFEKTEPHRLLMIGLDEARVEDEGIKPMPDDASLALAVERYVSKLAQADDFSGVVMVGKGAQPIFQNAYGYANREQKIRNTVETRFNLGSINKSFTQLAVHQLAARHKLTFTNVIKTFLPDYPNAEAAQTVSIQQLLDMSSGIGDFFGERYDATPKEKLNGIADYLPLFADKPLEFPPGSRRRYSNGGYIVLGAIIEKVSGTDYYSYVRSNIFVPAKMSRTDWFSKSCAEADVAVGYTKMTGPGAVQPGQSWHRNTAMLPQRGSSAGGGYSTAPDLLRYTVALQGELAPATFDARNGFGIAGGTEGVNSALDWDPRTGYAVIVLSNFDPPIAEIVARHIRALLPRK
jgi:CubicO group peptidase (beta-lactamase class C family)